MKLPELVKNILSILLFCSLLTCTTWFSHYLDAQRSPQAALQALRFFKKSYTPPQHVPVPQALFDGQQIKKTLLGLFDKAQPNDEILITTFIMTDDDICKAITKKHKQDVKIRIIADSANAEKDYSKVLELIKAGVKVYLYSPAVPTLMHNKFLLFKFLDSLPVVVTGSYNLTHSAATKNKENAVLISHKETLKDYEDQFLYLLQDSVQAR